MAQGLPDRIGRLSLVSGDVAFQLKSEADWATADFNYPVYDGMKIATDAKGRAEIGVGGNALRLSSDTEIEMATLSDRLLDIVVLRGHVHLSLHQINSGENVEIELSAGSVWPLQAGGYAAELGAEDQPSRVAVLDGKASVLGSNAELSIDAGQRALVEGDNRVSLIPTTMPSTGQPDGGKAAPPPAAPSPQDGAAEDDFIQWAVDRDTLPGTNVPQNLSRDTSGYQMLDEYGEWRPSETYGRVWYPTEVPADWQPYRYGHWVSLAPWGPTWVDDQPWGFVPFHYGRWAMIDGQWGWVPGDADEPEVYAPALVVFLGSPDQVLLDDSGGAAVGWVPLGPDEPYLPWYDAGDDYVRRVNAGHVHEFRGISGRRIAEIRRAAFERRLANRGFATVVSRATFAEAKPVGGAMVHVSAEHIAHAPAMMGAPQYRSGEGRHLLHAEPTRPRAAAAEHGNISPFHREPAPPAAAAMHAAGRGAAHPGAAGAGTAYRPHEAPPRNLLNREYQPPPRGQQFARPGTPAQFGRPGVMPQPQFHGAQPLQQHGFGGFQMPGRAAPMVRAPAPRSAPSGGHHK